ncbi:hypothetical protein ACVWZ4_005025 [Bradyrhizobium sp. USDA 4472]
MLAAAIGARQERVYGSGDWPDRAPDDVGVDLDAAVVEEAGSGTPAGTDQTDHSLDVSASARSRFNLKPARRRPHSP